MGVQARAVAAVAQVVEVYVKKIEVQRGTALEKKELVAQTVDEAFGGNRSSLVQEVAAARYFGYVKTQSEQPWHVPEQGPKVHSS